MRQPPSDRAEHVVGSLRGGRRFHRAPRRLIVTDHRVLVLDGEHVAADCPRLAVTVSECGRDRLVVELAGTPYMVVVPPSEREHAASLARTLGQDRLLAALRDVNLARRTRRALALAGHASVSIVVTADRLTVLARREASTDVTFCCPRSAVRVRGYETVWPGGDLLFDRVELDAAGTTLGFDVDGRLHQRVEAAVAALGGVSGPPTSTRPSRKATP